MLESYRLEFSIKKRWGKFYVLPILELKTQKEKKRRKEGRKGKKEKSRKKERERKKQAKKEE